MLASLTMEARFVRRAAGGSMRQSVL